ncbi:heavy-metal-associated domain-containing protein [Methanosarcina sp.]|uniref:heavy-metal-associated domain-containing protein n=1 Tax=Methanosarcina sp. TaxID=2213 RepID=UPI0029889BD6|nr:heavy-metal-associated domain-containing protein [Methanosarcina sp.]MDW5552211.1 heavy-metal-associated domain-containing protein [Methanosarcina sp.]MDW5553328.1 heavy-metal-associated domain-containing protein [Methanosarcina sp.]MDW5558209.1 heavy-metal-associated domain-containing protein [Methanosarcina sp.]
MKIQLCCGGEYIGETTFIVDDLVCRYCKDMVARLVTSINGVSRVNINIPERTVNVTYDSRITDAYVIQMTLLKAGYKIVEDPGKIF